MVEVGKNFEFLREFASEFAKELQDLRKFLGEELPFEVRVAQDEVTAEFGRVLAVYASDRERGRYSRLDSFARKLSGMETDCIDPDIVARAEVCREWYVRSFKKFVKVGVEAILEGGDGFEVWSAMDALTIEFVDNEDISHVLIDMPLFLCEVLGEEFWKFFMSSSEVVINEEVDSKILSELTIYFRQIKGEDVQILLDKASVEECGNEKLASWIMELVFSYLNDLNFRNYEARVGAFVFDDFRGAEFTIEFMKKLFIPSLGIVVRNLVDWKKEKLIQLPEAATLR